MAIHYELKFEDGEPIGCECCEYPAPVYLFERTMTSRGTRALNLCEVCSSTHLAVAEKYPMQVSDGQLYRAIGWVANHIISKLPQPPAP